MSTKSNPGKYDCYAKLEPDEPFYLLMGRSAIAPLQVRMELMLRRFEIRMGLRPDTPEENEQIAEGFRTVTEMEIFGTTYRNRKEVAGMEFDDKGRPLTGPHAYREHASTSGANET